MIADAACDLFLEQGYETTTISEITRRTGVSRSSFFNYFATKSEILWYVFDARAAVVAEGLARPEVPVADALTRFGAGDPPLTLALAIVDARTMGVESELEAGMAQRQLRLGAAISARLELDGLEHVRAGVVGAGYARALVIAVERWALLGSGRHRLSEVLGEVLRAAGDLPTA